MGINKELREELKKELEMYQTIHDAIGLNRIQIIEEKMHELKTKINFIDEYEKRIG